MPNNKLSISRFIAPHIPTSSSAIGPVVVRGWSEDGPMVVR